MIIVMQDYFSFSIYDSSSLPYLTVIINPEKKRH